MPDSIGAPYDEQHVERYTEIREQIFPQVQKELAATCEDTAALIGEVERELIDRLKSSIGDLRPAEAAGALRNASTAKAINVDKSALLRGQPTHVVEHRRNPEEVLAALKALGFGIVEGTAEEVPADAEVLELADPEELPPAA